MLVGHGHGPPGTRRRTAQREQGQDPLPGMSLQHQELVVREFPRLVEHVDGDARLAHVMHQRRESQIEQLELGQPDTTSQCHGQNADVHAVDERVLVEVAQRGHADQGVVIDHDLVDDGLYRALRLPQPGGSAHTHVRHQLSRGRQGLQESEPRPLLCRAFVPIRQIVDHRLDEEVRHARALELCHDLHPTFGGEKPRRWREKCRQEHDPRRGIGAARDENAPHARLSKTTRHMRDFRVRIELNAQPGATDEDVVADALDFAPFGHREKLRHRLIKRDQRRMDHRAFPRIQSE